MQSKKEIIMSQVKEEKNSQGVATETAETADLVAGLFGDGRWTQPFIVG